MRRQFCTMCKRCPGHGSAMPTRTPGKAAYRADALTEALLGDPAEMKEFQTQLAFETRYLSLTVAFAAQEVRVSAINAGAWRKEAGLVIAMILDAAYAGIPTLRRPPVYLDTHYPHRPPRDQLAIAQSNYQWPGAAQVIDGIAAAKALSSLRLAATRGNDQPAPPDGPARPAPYETP